MSLKEREEETTVQVHKSARTDVVLCLTTDACLCSIYLSIKREKREISFTVTMILVNGPRVTTYCDPPKQNTNLISLK